MGTCGLRVRLVGGGHPRRERGRFEGWACVGGIRLVASVHGRRVDRRVLLETANFECVSSDGVTRVGGHGCVAKRVR